MLYVINICALCVALDIFWSLRLREVVKADDVAQTEAFDFTRFLEVYARVCGLDNPDFVGDGKFRGDGDGVVGGDVSPSPSAQRRPGDQHLAIWVPTHQGLWVEVRPVHTCISVPRSLNFHGFSLSYCV